MRWFKKRAPASDGTASVALEALSLSKSLDKNCAMMERLFTDVDIFIMRRFANVYDANMRFAICYSDGVSDSQTINDFIMRPLIHMEANDAPVSIDAILDRMILVGEAQLESDVDKLIQAVTYGDTVLFVQGNDRALILNSKGFTLRGISEPESEKVLMGPREGFNEGLMSNLSMLRRRLRTHELKLKFMTLGVRTKTQVCVCYMDGIVNKSILSQVQQRLEGIEIDGVLDSNYLAEHIDNPSALGFTVSGSTERPDVVVSKLLEGRIAILVDGSPVALTVPFLFIENFQSNEDYYVNYYYATFSRYLRFFGFILTILVPGLFVAIVTHHHEVMPVSLLISIASERQNVPLPAAIEAFCMLIVFDILRETGIRMPTGVGQALSIVGALVIGQSAVEAGLVAAPMIIVVAFTGITNLLVPRMSAASLIARYGLLMLGSTFGILGLALGCFVLFTHIMNLQSMGVQQFIPIEDLSAQQVKDVFVRAPWPYMLTRIAPLTHNRVRQRTQGR